MGCVNSRTDINDLHPNIFQVMNVDDLGNLIAPGRLEVTESDIVLYQRGKQAIKWPLRCLRRYGYDAEIFSFESGRRCSTGPGIYAFKCRRAAHLFNLVQTNIQVCNNGGDDTISREHPAASHPVDPTMAVATRMTIPVEPNYLDPIANATTNSSNRMTGDTRSCGPGSLLDRRNHRSNGRLDSVGSGTALMSPRRNTSSSSPVSPPALPPPPPPLSPSNPSSLYVNEEILSSSLFSPLETVERNNNRKNLRGTTVRRSCTVSDSMSESGSVFSPQSMPVNKSLDVAPATAGSPPPSGGTGTYMNINIDSGVGPLLSSNRDGVPNATIVQEEKLVVVVDTNENAINAGHAYMNISPGQERIESIAGDGSGAIRPRPPTLLPVWTQQQDTATVEDTARHCYANLEPSEIENLRKRLSGAAGWSTASEKSSPMPPSTPTTTTTTATTTAAIREVNYAVLDLDTKDASKITTASTATVAAVASPLDGPSNSTVTPPESPNKLSQQQQKGYATIDFNKTAALSHSVNPNRVGITDSEGSRKTRHNSTISALAASSSSSSSAVRRSSSVSE